MVGFQIPTVRLNMLMYVVILLIQEYAHICIQHFSLTYFTKFQNGSFGGTYFRPIYSTVTKTQYGPEVWQELPQDWREGLDIQTQVI